MEEVFGRVFDKAEKIFLGRGKLGLREKLGSGVDNDGNAGFEFEVEPEKKISFAGGEILRETLIVDGLAADKIDHRSDEDHGGESEKRIIGIKILGEKKDKNERIG